MRLVPEDNSGKIMFYTTHAAKWLERADQIGTTEADVAELQALVDAAKAALTAQHRAQSTAESATLLLNLAIDKMAGKGSKIVRQIRTKAAIDGDAIYPLALIPPPADPSPLPAPGQPTAFKTELKQVGWLTLTWKCKNPRGAVGTMYKVSRRIGGSGPFHFLGLVGEKKFVDDTIPPGTASLTYEVQAVRSRKVGTAAMHNVYFGSIGIRSRMHIAA